MNSTIREFSSGFDHFNKRHLLSHKQQFCKTSPMVISVCGGYNVIFIKTDSVTVTSLCGGDARSRPCEMKKELMC